MGKGPGGPGRSKVHRYRTGSMKTQLTRQKFTSFGIACAAAAILLLGCGGGGDQSTATRPIDSAERPPNKSEDSLPQYREWLLQELGSCARLTNASLFSATQSATGGVQLPQDFRLCLNGVLRTGEAAGW